MKQNEAERLARMTVCEEPYWTRGVFVAGADEAGRGPLAGPVCAAVCALPKEPLIEGVNDSKKLSEKKRERLFCEITETGVYGVGFADNNVIDEINILQATKRAFCDAFYAMPQKPDALLVDAVKGLSVDAEQVALVHGDAISYLIAAASIIAKVTRDKLMREYDLLYPEYGFARHKGYGTREHIEAIIRYGPCPIHRQSFIGKWL